MSTYNSSEEKPKKKIIRYVVIAVCVVLPIIAILWWHIDTFIGPTRVKIGSVNCLRTVAHIIEKHETVHRTTRSNGTLLMSYNYVVDGQTFTTKEEVEYGLYQSYNPGDTCTVYYMKNHPSRSLISDSDIYTEKKMKVILFDIVMLISLMSIVYKWKKEKKEKGIKKGNSPNYD